MDDSTELEQRRRRARFRAWHRGTREMDLVMGRFVDASIATFSESEVADIERLIDVPDPDLYAWITGERPVDPEFDTPLFRRWREFNQGR
jgi:antitoxin CptB